MPNHYCRGKTKTKGLSYPANILREKKTNQHYFAHVGFGGFDCCRICALTQVHKWPLVVVGWALLMTWQRVWIHSEGKGIWDKQWGTGRLTHWCGWVIVGQQFPVIFYIWYPLTWRQGNKGPWDQIALKQNCMIEVKKMCVWGRCFCCEKVFVWTHKREKKLTLTAFFGLVVFSLSSLSKIY